jgi:hypothetical protein
VPFNCWPMAEMRRCAWSDIVLIDE